MKKLVCAVICIAIVSGMIVPAYAVSTGSAINLDDRLKLAELSSVATPSSAALLAANTATEVTPSQFAAQYWYYNNSSVSNDTAGNYSSWNGLIAGISRGFARSIQGLATNIGTTSTNEVNAITDVFNQLVNIRGYVDNLEDYTDGIEGLLTSIINSIGTSVGSTLTTISSRVNTTNSRLNTTNSTLGDILTAIENQSFTVPQQLLDDVSSIDSTTSTDSDRWVWSSTFNTNFSFPRYRQNGEGGSGSDLSLNPTVRSIPNQLFYVLISSMASDVYAYRDLLNGVSLNNTKTYLDKDLNPISLGRHSFWRDFRDIGGNINDLVARLAFVLANDDDIAARQAAQDNQSAAVDQFIKPTGQGSLSTDSIGDLASVSGTMSDALSSDVNPSASFGSFDQNSDAWGWFSQDVADSLSSPASRRSKALRSDQSKSEPSSDTPILDQYYSDLQKALGL